MTTRETARKVNEVKEKLRIARNLLQEIAMHTLDGHVQKECRETADMLSDSSTDMANLSIYLQEKPV